MRYRYIIAVTVVKHVTVETSSLIEGDRNWTVQRPNSHDVPTERYITESIYFIDGIMYLQSSGDDVLLKWPWGKY